MAPMQRRFPLFYHPQPQSIHTGTQVMSLWTPLLYFIVPPISGIHQTGRDDILSQTSGFAGGLQSASPRVNAWGPCGALPWERASLSAGACAGLSPRLLLSPFLHASHVLMLGSSQESKLRLKSFSHTSILPEPVYISQLEH